MQAAIPIIATAMKSAADAERRAIAEEKRIFEEQQEALAEEQRILENLKNHLDKQEAERNNKKKAEMQARLKEAKQKELEALQKAKKEKEAEKSKKEEELKSVQTSIEEAERKVQEAERNLKEFIAQKERIEKDIKVISQATQNEQQTKDYLSSKLEKLERERERLEHQLEKAEEALESAKEQLEKARDELAQTQKDIIITEGKLRSIQAQIAAKNQETKLLEEQLEQLRQEQKAIEEQIAAIDAQLASLERQLSQCNDYTRTSSSFFGLFKSSRTISREGERQALRSAIARLQGDKSHLQNRHNNNNNTINTLIQNKTTANSELQRLRAQEVEISAELTALKTVSLPRATDKVSYYKTKVANADNKVIDLQQRLESNANARETVSCDVKQNEIRLKELKDKLELLKKDEKKITDMKAAAESDLKAKKTTADKLQEDIKRITAEIDIIIEAIAAAATATSAAEYKGASYEWAANQHAQRVQSVQSDMALTYERKDNIKKHINRLDQEAAAVPQQFNDLTNVLQQIEKIKGLGINNDLLNTLKQFDKSNDNTTSDQKQEEEEEKSELMQNLNS